MAIFNPGVAVGQISGRVGGSVFSHNKGGPYIRNGTIPIQPSTSYKDLAMNRLTVVSRQWAGLGEPGRQSWRTWANQNPITNRLGKSILLSGNAAYIKLNTRLLASGDTVIAAPPAIAAPSPLLTFVATWDIGAGAFGGAFTVSPLGANLRLWVWGAVLDSPGARFVKNVWRLVEVTTKAFATPVVCDTTFPARFGTMVVGQHAFIKLQVFDSTTGLLSGPIEANGTIATT